MAKSQLSIQVPPLMQQRYNEITTLTETYCESYLDKEYAALSRLATAALCRKRPSPLQSGSATTWACGIVYAIGFVNFLFDKSTAPYTTAEHLAQAFGISKSTAGNKSKQVRSLLNIKQFDHRWCLPSRIATSSMIWMITLNGFIVDARILSRELQEIACRKGLIPYIFADKC